jgi:hypothetical protein
VTLSGTGSRRSPVPPAEMPRHVPAMPGTRTAQSRRQQPTSPYLPVRVRHLPPQEFCRAACAARPKVCAQGRWSVARAPVAGWTDHDKRIPGRRGGTDRTRAPRNRNPREAETGPLVASCWDYLALRPTSSEPGMHWRPGTPAGIGPGCRRHGGHRARVAVTGNCSPRSSPYHGQRARRRRYRPLAAGWLAAGDIGAR